MKRLLNTLPLILPLAMLLPACIIVDPNGGTDTDTGSSGQSSGASTGVSTGASTGASTTTTTTTTGASTSGGSSTGGGPTFCDLHCFEGLPQLFPSDDPRDESGNPVMGAAICETTTGDVFSFASLENPFPIPGSYCTADQDQAQAAFDYGVCDPGPIPSPVPADWDLHAEQLADGYHGECVERLTVAYDCKTSASDGDGVTPGASELCRTWLQYPAYWDMQTDAIPLLATYENQEVSPTFPCDPTSPLDCGAASGGVFGDLNLLVDSYPVWTRWYSYLFTEYDAQLEINIMSNEAQLLADGLDLAYIPEGDHDNDGFDDGGILVTYNSGTETAALFAALGIESGWKIREINEMYSDSMADLVNGYATLVAGGDVSLRMWKPMPWYLRHRAEFDMQLERY